MEERTLLRPGWALHKALFRLSGGRLGTSRPRGERVGALFLETIGRRSGEARRNGLWFVDVPGGFAVVASNAGVDRDPAWWLNLQARPQAVVRLEGQRIPVTARRATPGEEATLWPRLDAGYRRYAVYRERVSRTIPIVILERR